MKKREENRNVIRLFGVAMFVAVFITAGCCYVFMMKGVMSML